MVSLFYYIFLKMNKLNDSFVSENHPEFIWEESFFASLRSRIEYKFKEDISMRNADQSLVDSRIENEFAVIKAKYKNPRNYLRKTMQNLHKCGIYYYDDLTVIKIQWKNPSNLWEKTNVKLIDFPYEGREWYAMLNTDSKSHYLLSSIEYTWEEDWVFYIETQNSVYSLEKTFSWSTDLELLRIME